MAKTIFERNMKSRASKDGVTPSAGQSLPAVQLALCQQDVGGRRFLAPIKTLLLDPVSPCGIL